MPNDRTVYLVVHRKMLEEDRDDHSTREDERAEAIRVLDRIDQLAEEHPDDIRYFEGFLFDTIPRLVDGYDTVILCGCTRGSCLADAAIAITDARKPVAYDIRGTAN